MARMLKGSCLCGQTSYEVEDAFDYAMFCHCSQCRRTTGAACKPMGGIPVGKLRLTAGAASVLSFGKGDIRDVHCGACGSLIYSIVREVAWAHVAYGTLIDPPTLAPQEHIFAADRAPWLRSRTGCRNGQDIRGSARGWSEAPISATETGPEIVTISGVRPPTSSGPERSSSRR